MQPLFAMGGAACLALGPMLKKPLFAAIGSFVAAVGVLLAGIGACGIVYESTKDVMVTAVCIIATMFLASAVMIIRNRRFL